MIFFKRQILIKGLKIYDFNQGLIVKINNCYSTTLNQRLITRLILISQSQHKPDLVSNENKDSVHNSVMLFQTFQTTLLV